MFINQYYSNISLLQCHAMILSIDWVESETWWDELAAQAKHQIDMHSTTQPHISYHIHWLSSYPDKLHFLDSLTLWWYNKGGDIMVDNCSTTGQIVSPLLPTSTTTDIYLFMIFPKNNLTSNNLLLILSSSIRILIVTLLYMDFILKILKFGYLFLWHDIILVL